MHNPIEDAQANGQTRALADRLRQLPEQMQPPFNWQEFQRRSQRRLPAGRGRLHWSHAVAAGLVVLVVGGLAVWSRVGLVRHGMPEGGTTGGVAELGSGRDVPVASANRGSTEREQAAKGSLQTATADLKAASEAVRAAREALEAGSDQSAPDHSRVVESWLASLPKEPAVVRVGTRAAVAGLEDRIAQVDDLLTFGRLDGTQPDRLVALQQERAKLVGSLAQVRYAEYVASGWP
jgi:hypothetical protein